HCFGCDRTDQCWFRPYISGPTGSGYYCRLAFWQLHRRRLGLRYSGCRRCASYVSHGFSRDGCCDGGVDYSIYPGELRCCRHTYDRWRRRRVGSEFRGYARSTRRTGSKLFQVCDRHRAGYCVDSHGCGNFNSLITGLFPHRFLRTTAQLRPGTQGLAICHLCFASNDSSLGNRGLVIGARIPLPNRRPSRPRACTLYIIQGLLMPREIFDFGSRDSWDKRWMGHIAPGDRRDPNKPHKMTLIRAWSPYVILAALLVVTRVIDGVNEFLTTPGVTQLNLTSILGV